MKDKSNREIKHIRLSVTSKCNYNCIYCDKEGINPTTNVLSVEEIANLAQILAKVLKVTRIKLTGGEPLCREDIVQIIKKINDLNLYRDISMTTNGFNLDEKAKQLKEAGLNRVNVSLCSLNSATYEKITGVNALDKILLGLERAKEVGLLPIKLNYVVLKGLNDNEFEEMVNFSAKNGFVLQLIELHTTNYGNGKQSKFYEKYHFSIAPFIEYLTSKAINVITRGEMQNRKVYTLPGNKVVETVIPSHEFCMGCTKLRVGCDGNLFGCLYRSDLGKNIKTNLQNNDSISTYECIIRTVVNSRKPYY